jgi:ribosomal protein S12 methylthiotransferase accessory factor
MLTASLQVAGTPLPEIAARLRLPHSDESTAPVRFSIHAYSGTEPNQANHAPVANEERVLLWGMEPNRVRIGPVLDANGDSCLDCLSYWLQHNRPDNALWRSLPSQELYTLATFPWMPLHYRMIEDVSAAFLAGDFRRSFVDLEPANLSVRTHHYQPSPICSRCTPRVDDSSAFVKAPSTVVAKPDRATYRSNRLPSPGNLRHLYVDYRVGLVRHMYRELNSKMLPMWGAENKLPNMEIAEIGFGRHESARTSESVAVLEALERYCGFAPRRRKSTVRGSYAGLMATGEPVLDPRSFILSDATQQNEPGYDLAPYSEDLVYDWIWAYSCRRSSPVLIPQQLCFYGATTPKSEKFVLETSNGCALGSSLEEAAFHGLLEVIERDAYMTRWYLHAAPKRIELNDPAMPDVQRLYARALAEGYELAAFDIHLEVPIPVVLAMIIDPSEGAGVASYCASAAHPQGAKAVMGALVEICSSIAIYKEQFAAERERASALWLDSSLVQEMRDHVLLYSVPESLGRLSFLDRSSQAHSASSIFPDLEKSWSSMELTTDLHRLVSSVCQVADDVLIVDQTASILDPLGLHCVKVLAPGLLPVTFGHQYRRISPHRLSGARNYLQAKGEASEPTINLFPHNFP